jgi:putative hydrolase of the HAD superfamily
MLRSLERPRTMLLDLDDTIVDFESSGQPRACWLATIEARFGGSDAASILAAIDETRRWFWSDPQRFHLGSLDLGAATASIVRVALLKAGIEADEALARGIAEDYRDLRDAGLCLFDGALEALQALRDEGVRLGLVTNGSSSDQRGKLSRFGLAPFFEHVVIWESSAPQSPTRASMPTPSGA